MKKIIPILLTLSILLMGTPLVSAQGNSQVRNTEDNFNRRASEILARIVSKVENRIDKYEEFSGKLMQKRNELSEASIDVSELDRLIRVAELNLTTTKADVTEMKATLDGLDYTLSKRELVRSVVSEVRDIRQSFRTLHQSMTEVVSEIRSLSN